jgi:hypothetical protein
MATIKIKSPNTRSSTSGITSSNVSSSLSGNIKLIKSQTINKNVDYINVKNAVKILENYSNWNGYIKLYTEVQSNFEVDDTVYITYLSNIEPSIENLIYNLSNPLEPDEGGNRFYLGYKILYVNSFKNEIVINRYFNDIGAGKILSNQYLSRVSCMGGNLFDDISDGVVFYNCNILNGGFGRISGVVSGSTGVLSGAKILCSGLIDISDFYGNYSLNVPSGDIVIKCFATGYITNTFKVTISESSILIMDILMIPGSNSITITSDIVTAVCYYDYIQFSASTIGYDNPVTYQWKLKRNDVITTIGSDNPKLSYSGFQQYDEVYCTVTDTLTSDISNKIQISTITPSVYITPDTVDITYGSEIIFNAYAQCYANPTYEWRVNNVVKGNTPIYISSTLKNGDKITCIIAGVQSNTIIAKVAYISTQLSFDPYSSPRISCFINKPSTYYIIGSSFTGATIIFKNSGGTLADLGVYSDGINYRSWNPNTQYLDSIYSCSTQSFPYTGNGTGYTSNNDACNSTYSPIVTYYTSTAIDVDVVIFNNSSLTIPYSSPPITPWISIKANDYGARYSIQVDPSGVIRQIFICQ